VPQLESAAGIKRAYNNQINTVRGTGGQIANNAAMEAVNRAGINGGQVNSEMVKAQTMLPVYDQTSKLQADKAQAVAAQHHQQVQMMASIAQQMANIRSTYLTNLGQYQLNKQNQSNQFYESQRDFAAKQAQLATLQSASPASTSAAAPAIAPFSGQMTRAKNDSGASVNGVEFTPQFLQYLNASGNRDVALRGAPQYPQIQGIGAGSSIDKYEAMLRNLAHIADPRTAEYDEKLLSVGQRAPSFTQDLNPDKQSYAGRAKYGIT
jgi:hypothetical protein